MKIDYHRKFLKSYSRRIKNNPKLDKIFKERVALFVENFHDPCLNNHPLTGSLKKLRSFSVTGDIRVIYQPINKNLVLFLDVGSHSQVY